MSKLSTIGGALLALADDDGVLGGATTPTSLTRERLASARSPASARSACLTPTRMPATTAADLGK
jgi:hypothetical protein